MSFRGVSVCCSAFVCFIVTLCLVPAAPAAEYSMKISLPSPMTEWTQFNEPYAVLKTEIEKRSAERIEVKLYPAGVLGDVTSATDQVGRGIIQGAQVGDGWIANPFAEIQLIFIPYGFKDRDVAWYVLAVVTYGPTVNLWLPRSFGFAGS